MKLKDIRRTATFAWSPSTSERHPLLATGTVAGALDESFSNESQLEIWDLDFMEDELEVGGAGQKGPKAFVNDNARYNRLAWGSVNNTTEKGVVAAGLENGELALWNPAKILAGADPTESLILRNTIHTGPVRGLDFNPLAQNLLASGGVAGEVYIWDLKDPSKPYTPTSGTRNQKLDEMTSVAWNQKVQYVLAGASSTGYTVVWDLRGKREVASLAYGGGAGTLAGANALGGVMAAGGRRGMSDIAWHPDNATRLVTSSEDDSSPVIMVWDLRNARAPEKILSGHEKGILSLSWCKHDADLLLSCGKDNRTLCWNPQTSEIIGELPAASNWAFQVDWCPRNPDILATAFFDGTIGIHSTQTTNDVVSQKPPISAKPDGSDVWGQPIQQSSGGTFSLKQTPKWLRRPVSSTFGFGGKLVSVSNLPDAQGQHQSSSVHLRSVVTEQDFVERARVLEAAISGQNVQDFAEQKVEGAPSNDAWKALLTLFKANSREELVTLLGFSKAEIAARVAEAVDNLKASATRPSAEQEEDITETELTDKVHEPVVSFAEPEKQEAASDSETAGGSSIASSAHADAESTTTVPSLFGEDDGPGTPQIDAGQDFFNTVGIQQDNGESLPVHVPHTNYPIDSSVAATIGSRPSSAASAGALSLKENSFKIYPANESETDRLVTKALVLGDFESAVQLCLSSDRYADAILLAVRGGPDLLAKTQKAYFEKRTTELPYLRLFQSIVTNDLADIVQNADLAEWQEIFVVICTFASQEEFASLAEQLGMRLEFQGGLVAKDEDEDSDDDEDSDEEDSDEEDEPPVKSNPYRKNATLTYLAAAKLERLVNIWGEDLLEEEKTLLAKGTDEGGSHFSIHANALLSFVEKVSIFRSATSYKDEDLNATASSNSNASIKTYKLAGLYDRYLEYAELLSTQGLLKEASSVLNLIPASYNGSSPHLDRKAERERLVVATGGGRQVQTQAGPSRLPGGAQPAYGSYATPGGARPPVPSGYAPYQPNAPIGQGNLYGGPSTFQQPNAPPAPAPSNTYGPPPTNSTYAPPTTNAYAPPAPSNNNYAPAPSNSTYAPPPNNFAQPPHLRDQGANRGPPPGGLSGVPAPPPPVGMTPPPARAPPKRDPGGWNDAPAHINSLTSARPNSVNVNKPSPITAPFPNAPLTPGFGSPVPSPYMGGPHGGPSGPPPGPHSAAGVPPPRPGSVNRGSVPPPPQAGRVLHQPPVGYRPPSVVQQPPPQRMMSPSMHGGAPPPHQGHGGPDQYGPPPLRGPSAGPPPPGPYAPQVPPQGQYQQQQQQPQHHHQGGPPPPPPSGPYAPSPGGGGMGGPIQPPPRPPSNASQYAPPRPGSSQHGPPGSGGPPPPGGAGGPPRAQPARQGPPPPKYPPGDRSHIPDHVKPAYEVIVDNLNRMKQITPPQQKRVVDDLERRLNGLFDQLNCETLSQPVVEQLIDLTRAMDARDRPSALAIHVDLLTRGSQTDDIALWMSALKQLIMRL